MNARIKAFQQTLGKEKRDKKKVRESVFTSKSKGKRILRKSMTNATLGKSLSLFGRKTLMKQ